MKVEVLILKKVLVFIIKSIHCTIIIRVFFSYKLIRIKQGFNSACKIKMAAKINWWIVLNDLSEMRTHK